MTYGDVSIEGARREAVRGSNTGARQVTVDLTLLVTNITLWELTGNDRTLRVERQVAANGQF